MCALFTGYFIVFRNREHLIGSRPQAAAIPPGRGGTTKMIPCQTRAGYIYTAEEKAHSKFPQILTALMMTALHCLSTFRCEFAKAVIDRCAGRIRKCRVSKSQETVLFFVI